MPIMSVMMALKTDLSALADLASCVSGLAIGLLQLYFKYYSPIVPFLAEKSIFSMSVTAIMVVSPYFIS
jgi:hypothetical protein